MTETKRRMKAFTLYVSILRFWGEQLTKRRSLQEPGFANSDSFLRQIGLRTGCSSGFDEPANGLKIVHRRKRQSEINRDEQQEDLPYSVPLTVFLFAAQATIRTQAVSATALLARNRRA
jgi:hypothetical protein